MASSSASPNDLLHSSAAVMVLEEVEDVCCIMEEEVCCTMEVEVDDDML